MTGTDEPNLTRAYQGNQVSIRDVFPSQVLQISIISYQGSEGSDRNRFIFCQHTLVLIFSSAKILLNTHFNLEQSAKQYHPET